MATQSSKEHYFLGLSDEGYHRIHYREYGASKKNKPTIICVHGVTRLAQDFDILARELAKDYRVICPDIVGRGQSDWLNNYRNYNFIQYCADMNALLARLNVEQVHWLGTSMGGLIGIMMAALPNSPICSLIVNDVGPELKLSELRRLGQYIGKAPHFKAMDEVVQYVKETYSAYGNLSAEQWQQFAAISTRKENDKLTMHYDPKIGDAFRASYSFYNFNLWKYWDSLQCPTLTIRGEQSKFLPIKTAKKMLTRGPSNSLIEIEDVGHAPILQSPHEITVISDFFNSL